MVDLNDADELCAAVDETRPDVVLHFGGYVSAAIDPAVVVPTFTTLLTSSVALLTAADQGRMGRLVLIGSVDEPRNGRAPISPYGAAKAGLNHMTRSLAEEWGPGIRVNCLALGATLTENFRNLVLGDADLDGKQYFEKVPMKRGGSPEEVANTCLFLCSGQADYINGTTIEIDGGMMPGVLYEPGIEQIKSLLAKYGA